MLSQFRQQARAMVARKEHKNPAIYLGKFEWKNLLFQVWGFIFIPIIFSFVKAQVSFYFKTFFKTQIFQISWFFLKLRFFIILNNVHVIYLPVTIAGSKKMKKMALMIKMVSTSFMLHVPLDCNY